MVQAEINVAGTSWVLTRDDLGCYSLTHDNQRGFVIENQIFDIDMSILVKGSTLEVVCRNAATVIVDKAHCFSGSQEDAVDRLAKLIFQRMSPRTLGNPEGYYWP